MLAHAFFKTMSGCKSGGCRVRSTFMVFYEFFRMRARARNACLFFFISFFYFQNIEKRMNVDRIEDWCCLQPLMVLF